MKLKNYSNYEIDIEKGTIYSYKSNTTIGHLNSDGYMCTTIYDDSGNPKTIRHHRIIWETAYGEIPSGYEIHHLDENRSNNTISNLELIESSTHRHNHFDGSSNPMYGKPNPKSAEIGRRYSKPVACFTMDNELVKTYPSIADVVKDGFDRCNVSKCCNGKYSSSKGFKWKFMG